MRNHIGILLLIVLIPLTGLCADDSDVRKLQQEIKDLKQAISQLEDKIELLELASELNDENGSSGVVSSDSGNSYYEQWQIPASNDYATLEYSTAVTNWVVSTNGSGGLVYQVWQINAQTNRVFDWVRAHAE